MSMTDDAFVREFQRRAGLVPDGDAGTMTLAALRAAFPGVAPHVAPDAPVPASEAPGVGARVAILIGHNAKSQGAARVADGRSEYDWNGALAAMMTVRAPAQVRVFRRQSGGGYRAEIARAYAEIAAWRPNAVMELHFNSFHLPANGCEMLHGGSPASARLARAVQDATVRVLGNRSRGLVVIEGANPRGGASVNALPGVPSILTEPYFGSNAAECATAQDRMQALATAQINAALAFVAAGR